MLLPLGLAIVDALVAAYLLAWALRRQRRDKPLVVVVGLALLICAVFLMVVGWPHPATDFLPTILEPGTEV